MAKFNSLLKETQNEEEKIMLGQIEFENFKGLEKMPQKVASAWSAFETSGFVGASYKPLLYIGEQTAKGVNYWFIAEQTLTTKTPVKKIITMALNDFNGKVTLVKPSIKTIF